MSCYQFILLTRVLLRSQVCQRKFVTTMRFPGGSEKLMFFVLFHYQSPSFLPPTPLSLFPFHLFPHAHSLHYRPISGLVCQAFKLTKRNVWLHYNCQQWSKLECVARPLFVHTLPARAHTHTRELACPSVIHKQYTDTHVRFYTSRSEDKIQFKSLRSLQ